jgi:hypothetical protein
MAKYKLSEGNINEFWGWFGKRKPAKLQKVVDDDPVLKKIDKDLEQQMTVLRPYANKLKKQNPDVWKYLKDNGLIPDL